MTDRLKLIELQGMPVASLHRHEAVDHIFASLRDGTGGWLVTANVNHLYHYVSDPSIRSLYQKADVIVADGVPLVWAARLQGTPLPDRIAGSDLVWLLGERAALEGRSIYLLGGGEGAAERAGVRLQERWPDLRLAGLSSPRFSAVPSAAELESILGDVLKAQPDLVMVALGAPKQDRVIAALLPHLPTSWWIGVGISFSFMAGTIRRSPLWMQRAGLEWVYRLLQEPLRLSRRYLVADLPFAIRLLVGAWARRS